MNQENWWNPVIRIDDIVGRNYDMFGLLFGVRNYANYDAIAENRGTPEYEEWQLKNEDESKVLTQEDSEEWGVDGHSHTWMLYSEIEKIDWEKETNQVDERIHQYVKQKDGSLKYFCKFSAGGEIDAEDYEQMKQGKEVVKDKFVFKLEKLKLKDALGDDWQHLFNLMKELARVRGPENVRLVVWFDN